MKIIRRKGIIFRVYFEHMYEQQGLNPPVAGRVYACTVIADNAEEAMKKAKAAYPEETINSIHSQSSLSSGPQKPEEIIL